MAAIFVFVLCLFIFPVKIIDVVQPYKIVSKVVKRGGVLTYEVEYKKYTNSPAIVYRNIICEDGNLVTLAPIESNVPKGDHKLVRSDVMVPMKTSLGECRLDVTLDYHVNMFRHKIYNFESESFEVT
jgi:hypothetical protein